MTKVSTNNDKISIENKKHELFALEFIIDLNATRAYKKVYKSTQKVAEVNGCKLLRNTKVAEFIKSKLSKKFEKADISSDWVLSRLTELVDRCMQKVPVMVRQGKTMVQKQEYHVDPETGEEKLVGVRAFDSAGANSALDKLAKYCKLYNDGLTVNVTIGEDELED